MSSESPPASYGAYDDNSVWGWSDPGGSTIIGESTTSTHESQTDWGFIAFTILWAIALMLLIAQIYIIWRNKKTRQATRSAQEGDDDVEVQQKNERQASNKHNDNEGCMPFGPAMAIPVFLSLAAFLLSVFSHTSCEFIHLENDGTYLSLGLWRVAYVRNGDYGSDGLCYSTEAGRDYGLTAFQVEPGLVVARVAAIFASLVGGICMLILLFSAVSPTLGVSAIRRLGLPLLFTIVSQLLTLSIYSGDQCSSNESCWMEMDYGGIASMTAVIYWFLCALGVSLLPMNNE